MGNSKVLWALVITIMVVVSVVMFVQNHKLKIKNQQIQDYFEQTTQTIGEIQDSLDQINTKELMIKKIAQNTEINDTITTDTKAQILQSIDGMNHYIEANKQKIAKLEKDLEKNKMRMNGMHSIIAKLKQSIIEKEQMITDLRSQIDLLTQTILVEREKAKLEISMKDVTINNQSQTISGQHDTIGKQNEMIRQQAEILNTIYYVIGTKAELVAKGILEKGSLFTKAKLSHNYLEDNFVKMNIQDVDQIVIQKNIKKIKILSAQNKNSYIVKSDTNSQSILKITNPDEFKRIKYLIIQVD